MNDEKKIRDSLIDVHALDEAITAMATIAEAMTVYYRALLENGMPKDVAKQMVIEYQNIMLRGGK